MAATEDITRHSQSENLGPQKLAAVTHGVGPVLPVPGSSAPAQLSRFLTDAAATCFEHQFARTADESAEEFEDDVEAVIVDGRALWA